MLNELLHYLDPWPWTIILAVLFVGALEVGACIGAREEARRRKQ
jgi:hypothetical protein